MDSKPQPKKKGDVAGRLLQKMLMPIVATAASAGATYAAKKAPQLLEDRVLPKLRRLVDAAGDVTHDLPAKAKSAAGGAGDVAEQLTERARSVAGDAVSGTGSNGHRRKGISSGELERRRDERQHARAERRKVAR
jgi:hypothetical protein